MARFTIAATVAAIVTLAHAQSNDPSISKQCPFNEICYSLNLPTSDFTAGHSDLYLQISGPATYSWIGLGQGSGMEGANMFIIYADGKGNVTLSPRLGANHVEPQYHANPDVQLLAGSGIVDGKMVANVRCGNCSQWEGGSMDLKGDIGTWIGAALPGPSLDSTDPEEHIQKHFVHAVFPWSMVAARGGDGSNPFFKQQSWSSQALGGIGTHMAIAHGVLACIAFLVILPSGAIFVRFARFPKLVWVHAACQITGYLIYVAAAGLGLHMMMVYPYQYHLWDLYTDPHPKIGMALLAYLFFQPISGAINHWLFGKKGKRLFSHYIHIWGGRLAILLGFINGGLGLRLVHVEYAGYRAAYGVVATVMGVAFIVSIVTAETHRDAPNPSYLHRRKKGEQGIVGESSGHVRMESMEDRERLNAGNGDRL